MDGDGIGDQIVGAPGAGSFGKAYVFSGVDGSLIFDTNAEVGGATYGEFFVSGVGDVNNDGTPDVYVGDYDANNQRGRVYIYSGATGAVLHIVTGAALGDGVGPGRGAGDVNHDGFDDFIVGYWSNSSGASLGGRVRVFSGFDKSVLRTMTGNVNGANLGYDAVGVGDVNADGEIDFLLSAATGNTIYVVAGEGCEAIADTPIAEPEPNRKSRYLSFDPVNAGVQSAIRVMLTELDGFPESNGQVQWVGPPQAFPEGSNPTPTFMGAALQCTPHFQDWGSVGMLHVYGEAVVPNSTYDVEVFIEECPSVALTLHTARYGDMVVPFNPPFAGSQPDIADVLATVDKWLGFDLPVKARAQLQPEIINPAQVVGIADILIVVDSWLGVPYSYDGPTACP